MASIIFDASTLISLSDTCNASVLRFLQERVDGKFYITPGVQNEIIGRPMGIRKYEASALRLKNLLDDGVLQLLDTPNLQTETKKVLGLTNNLFYTHGRPLQLVQLGEAECVAAFAGAKLGAIAMDEKTMRLLIENPRKLLEPISSEYRTKIEVRHDNMEELRAYCNGIRVIRSSELLAIAAEKGYFSSYRANAKEAAMSSIYAVRHAGLSITEREIKEYENKIIG